MTSMEELPSNSMGMHQVGPFGNSGQVSFPSQALLDFDLELPDQSQVNHAIFDMEDLDLRFSHPSSTADSGLQESRMMEQMLALDGDSLADANRTSQQASLSSSSAHFASPPTIPLTASPPERPPQKKARRVVGKKQTPVKIEVSLSPKSPSPGGAEDTTLMSPTLQGQKGVKEEELEQTPTDSLDQIALQKKRSCEASARYRRKKQKEEDDIKTQLNKMAAEKQTLQQRVDELQDRVRLLETDKAVLKAKLEVYEAHAKK